jgi:hypothetical protein
LQELTIADRATIAYNKIRHTEERKYRADLEKAIEADAMVHLLAERAYIPRRREAYLTVPGMSAHYPNPHYPVPAQLLPGAHFQRPQNENKRSIFDVVLGKKIVKSYFALPVGRKPSAQQLREQTELLINGRTEEAAARVRLAGYEDSDSEDNAADGNEEEEEGLRSGRVASEKSGLDYSGTGTKSVGCMFSFLFSHRNHMRTAEDPSAGSAKFSEEAQSARFGSRKRRAQKRTDNHMFVRAGKIPAVVFLGRRGMYPAAPGLEEFVAQLRSDALRAVEAEAAIKRAQDRRDTSTAYAKSMREEVMSRKDASERTKMRELLSREALQEEKVRKAEIKRGMLMRFKINVSLPLLDHTCVHVEPVVI